MQLNIMLVDKCNLRCKMCRHHLNSTGQIMRFEDYENILHECVGLTVGIQDCTHIRLDGGREALLYPRISDCVSLAKRLGFGTTMASNAVLLTSQISEKLLRNGLDWINFSVTGITPEVYRNFQGFGKSDEHCKKQLARVLNNIRKFAELRNSLGSSCYIRISYIVTEESIQDINNAIFYWENAERMADSIFFGADFENLIDESNFGKLDYSQSSECVYSMTIAANGDVYACCKSNENIVIGNAFSQSLRDIVKSSRYYDVARAIGSLNPELMPPACRVCPSIASKRD